MRIKFIVPIITREPLDRLKEGLLPYVSPGTKLDVESIRYGTESNESFFDEAVNSIGVLELAEKAQNEGFDGVFIECMLDLGLEAAREKLYIPVVGPGRIAMLCAGDLADTFSVVTVLENSISPFKHLASSTGLRDRLVSVRSIEIPVVSLKDNARLLPTLLNESVLAIEEDGAHAIILGCTRMLGAEKKLTRLLAERGHIVPVISGIPLGLKYLEMLIHLDLSQSKLSYMTPPEKKVDFREGIHISGDVDVDESIL